MSFLCIDLMCPKCEYEEERRVDMRGAESEEEKASRLIIKCPNCEEADMQRVWRGAPAKGGAKYGSTEEVAKMKDSFNHRFIKKDLDSVRHKFGKLYDDGVRTAAVDRIKKEIKE